MSGNKVGLSHAPIIFLAIFLSILIVGCSSPKDATTNASTTTPGYVKKDYKQLLVFARVEEDAYRHKVEDAMVELLNKNGYKAMPAYKHVAVSYKYDSTQFMSRINELNIDGIIALSYLGQRTVVEDRYYYTGGVYNVFSSNSIPWDLDTKSDKVGYIRADFFNLDTRSTQWNMGIAFKFSTGIDRVVEDVIRECYSRLKRDRII
jgi:hypothetical protein